KIANRRTPQANVQVLLEMDDGVLIYRQRKPKLLTVTFPNGVSIVSNVAQEHICKVYGHNETWMSTCYLAQDKFHPIIDSDPSASMKLLNRIAFDSDDPTQKIAKLNSAIRQAETDVALTSGQVNSVTSYYASSA